MRERRTSLMRSPDHLRVIPLSIACLCNLQSKLVSIIFLTRFPSFVFLRLLFIPMKSPVKRLKSHNVLQVEITFIECRYVYRKVECLCVNGTMDFYYINIRNLFNYKTVSLFVRLIIILDSLTENLISINNFLYYSTTFLPCFI